MDKKKYYYIDFIRIFSMFAVIFLHAAADLLRVDYLKPVWHFSNVLTALFSSSVPLFFMISGAMLISNDKSSSVSHLFKVRIKKVLFPFLFWSVFAIIYYFVTDIQYFSNWNIKGLIHRLKYFMGQPVTIHLWFMYALIPIYLLLPFIKILIDNLNRKKTIYLFTLWAVFSVILPTLASVVTSEYKMIFALNSKYDLSLFGGYLGFFILGYYLHIKDIKIKKRWVFAYIILNITTVSILTYIGTKITGGYFENFKTYSCFFTATLAISIFILIKQLCEEINYLKFEKIISRISETSFAVYLMHNLIIHFMNLNYFIVPNGSILRLISRCIVIYIICFVITAILNRIKPLSFISTGIKYKGLKK